MPDRKQFDIAPMDMTVFERKKHSNPLRRLRAWLYWKVDR